MQMGCSCPLNMRELSAEMIYCCQKVNGDIPIKKIISLHLPELIMEEAKYQLVEQLKAMLSNS